jgi:hypothetical protein
MKFNLRAKGAVCKSFATVKDHLANHIQSTYDGIGEQVSETIRTLKLCDWDSKKPWLVEGALESSETDPTIKALEEKIHESSHRRRN